MTQVRASRRTRCSTAATTPRRHRSSSSCGTAATPASSSAPTAPRIREFVKQAGQSSKDAILSCPCGPATGSFADEYTKKFSQPPGTYSTEGYDLGTILLKGIDSGAVTRPALLDYVKKYDGRGVARKYQWTDKVSSPPP